jgi:hypothetical protein
MVVLGVAVKLLAEVNIIKDFDALCSQDGGCLWQ